MDRKYSGNSVFATKIVCGDCGAFFDLKVLYYSLFIVYRKYEILYFKFILKIGSEYDIITLKS